MNTATARRQNPKHDIEWEPVSTNDDSQLQARLKEGWTIDNVGVREVRLSRQAPDGSTKIMTHYRRRAKQKKQKFNR